MRPAGEGERAAGPAGKPGTRQATPGKLIRTNIRERRHWQPRVIDPSKLWLVIHEPIGHATELDRARLATKP
ncbi:MAG TPA: hypothetical protein VGR98_06850, partial [Streptosporangiaceae bacterium]|nr:hypothetical protein [Streptosporangiaceae bacterium]